jgi:hypothetical protein
MDPRFNAEISALRRAELDAARRRTEGRRAPQRPRFATIFRTARRSPGTDL